MGSFPARGSLFAPLPLELSLSDPDRDEKEFLLLADDDDYEEEEEDEDDEEAAADSPFKTSGAAFLTDFRELPGVLGKALYSSSVISKMSWLRILLGLEVVDMSSGAL